MRIFPITFAYEYKQKEKKGYEMNLLWGGMILVGILYGAVTGNLGAVTEAAVDSAKEAVNLCVVMAGVT